MIPQSNDRPPHPGIGRSCPSDSCLIGAAAVIFAVGVIFWLTPFMSGDLHWDGDVVNRSVVLGYDKSHEVRLFILSCLLVPGLSGFMVFLHRLQRRRWPQPAYIEALIHIPLILWPLALLFLPEYVGVSLLISCLAYICARILLLSRDRLTMQEEKPDVDPPEEHTASSSRIIRREFIIASILLSAVGVSSIAAPGLSLPIAVKTITLLALVAGILMVTIIWWILTRVISQTGKFAHASILSGFMVIPPSGFVFSNLYPASAMLKFGGVFICILLTMFTAFMVFRRRDSRLMKSRNVDHRMKSVLRVIWWGVAPVILFASVYIYDTTGSIDLYHEGERITPAEALMEGAAPYRDIFLWHGLFENGFKARLGLAIDDSVAGVRRVEHLLEPLELVALYALLSACLRSPLLGLVAAIIAAYTLPSPHGRYWLAYLAYASLTWWLVRGRQRVTFVGLAGASAILALFYSLDGGLAAMVAVAAGLVYGSTIPFRGESDRVGFQLRNFGAAALGACVAALFPLGYLAYHGSIGAWLQSAWDIAGGLSDRSSIPYPALLSETMHPLRNDASIPIQGKVLAMYLPPLVIVWGLSHLFVRRIVGAVRGSSLTLPVALIGAALFFRAVIRRPDADHLAKILPLIYVVTAVLVLHHVRRLGIRGCRRNHYISHGIILGSAVFTFVWICDLDSETAPVLITKSITPHQAYTEPPEPVRQVDLDRAGPGVVAYPGRATWLEHLVKLLANRLDPDDTFYDFTNRGLLYFLVDRPCPTRYAQTTYAGSRRAQHEVIDALALRKPSLVVFPSSSPLRYAYDRLYHPFRHPVITRYLYRNYVPWTMVGDAIILRIKSGATHVDGRRAMNFIQSHAFTVDLGHIPRLQGELSVDVDPVREWHGRDLAKAWRPVGEIVYTDSGDEILRIHSEKTGKLTSPRLSLSPEPAQTVVLTLRSRYAGDAQLVFSSDRHKLRYLHGGPVRRPEPGDAG